MKPLPPSKTASQSGFTVIELLVSISVLALMLSLAAQIFYTAQEGVDIGLQTSQIIAEQRAISQPLFDDFTNMHVFESQNGGNTPGFLVIVQQRNGGVLFPSPDEDGGDTTTWTADRDGNGTPGQPSDLMRTDQVSFFRDASGLSSLTPGGNDRYGSQARAQIARVWYGHTSPATGGASIEPGASDNNLSSQLVLGRQALLLVEDSGGTAYPTGQPGNTTAPPGREIRTGTGRLDNSNRLRNGESDVLDLNSFQRNIGGTTVTLGRYDDAGDDLAAGTPTERSLFRFPGWDTGTVSGPSYFESLLARNPMPLSTAPMTERWNFDDRLTTPAYANAASEWAFDRAGRRLQAAQDLSTDFETGIFESDQVAQLHANFSPHVADFAIEFAADWIDNDGNGLPDNEPDRDNGGNIVWYTTLDPNHDGNVSTVPNGTGVYDGIGQNRPNDPVTYFVPNVLPRFNGTTGTFVNPFVYQRSPAPAGPLITYNPGSPVTAVNQTVLVWSHSGDDPVTDPTHGVAGGGSGQYIEGAGKYWPYMIRFRYRLMDGSGDFRSLRPGTNDRVVGRWFEQVVPVRRPTNLF